MKCRLLSIRFKLKTRAFDGHTDFCRGLFNKDHLPFFPEPDMEVDLVNPSCDDVSTIRCWTSLQVKAGLIYKTSESPHI